MCLPIFNCQDSVVGVLQLLNRRRPFSATDREFLGDICTYIGVALHNAWTHHDLKQSKAAEQELRLMRERLAQADKQSALTELVASIVHEIRNPLTVAKGQCAFFQQEPGLTLRMQDRLKKIDTSIARAVTIAQNFLNNARQDRTQQTTDVNGIINQTVDLMAYDFRSRCVSVVLDLETLPLLDADFDNLQQVLLNLLRNALYAASEREDAGTVCVRSSYRQHKQTVRIEISDNGSGIPHDLQSRIFEPFFSTKPSGIGTGLGLAVSKRIIEQHQGALSFESAVGVGTTFAIEIPVEQVFRQMAAGS